MSIADLYSQGEHMQNVEHFASLVCLAKIDNEINEQEDIVLHRLAEKLDITEEEYSRITSNPSSFTNYPLNTQTERLEKLYELFRIIFSDHSMDCKELEFLKKYTLSLGFTSDFSSKIINKSIKLFNGELSIEDYLYLIQKSTLNKK